jgi:putative ABC transport system permease protein
MTILGRVTRLANVRPALSAVIVGTLALGIGSATALYSVIEAVLLRPYPFHEQGRLAILWQADIVRNHPFVEISYLAARDWATRTSAFESIASMSSVNFATTLTGVGDPRQLQVRVVSHPFFEVLGSTPVLGRTLTADDHRAGSARVMVIGYGVWQTLYGGDPGVVGRSMTLDNNAHTIVGVMPRDFHYPDGAELWAPVEQALSATALDNRGLQWMVAIGRLAQGVSFDQGRAALDLTIGLLAREQRTQGDWSGIRAVVRPLVGELLGTTRQALLLLLCAVVAVLLIACANVANLLLSRSVDRRREIATRIMLGASRGRLARQLIGEVLPLSVAGGALGVGVAWIALESLVRIAGAELPRADGIALNLRALAVATVLSLGCGLLCALAPLLHSREVTLGSAVREDARAGTSRLQRRLRDGLVAAEIALALVLLVGAGLLIASFASLRSQDLGFQPDRVLTAEVSLSPPRFQSLVQIRLAQRDLVERFRAIPGVETASGVLLRPLWSTVGNDNLHILEGQRTEDATKNPVSNLESAMPGYFATMGIRLVSGRDFTERDDDQAPGVIIVSESFARSAWPGQDPLGRRLRISFEKDTWLTVVGVVVDARYREIETARLDVYQPYGQSTGPIRFFVIRAAGDPTSIAADVRRAVHAVDPSQPVELLTMNEIVSTAMGRWRLNARLFGALALLALLLAAVGTYSVMNYAVSRRTHEIGVRMALGAGRPEITRMVLGDGLRLALVGVTAGTLIAFSVTGLLSHLLIGVGPRQPAAFAAAAGLLSLVAITACLIPARRAAAVDPVVAMRTE